MVGVLGLVSTASANPVYLANSCQTATATTTVNFMQAGLATTTINCEVIDYRNSQKGESAIVLMQSVASSSASLQTVTISYSMDGVDYYDVVNTAASTTPNQALNTQLTYILAGNSLASTTRRAFIIDTPTKWIRLAFSATTGNSSIWAKIIPFKQGK